jgi:hypothetical protein
MNKSQRILFNSGTTDNSYIKINLEQQVETLEFLSLSLTSDNIYQSFNSDYGVLIGRVIANDNVGIPNAKISIFIPISENDINNDELYSLYPYKTPRDKNSEGKRYNLLPRVSKLDPVTNLKKPKQAFGSFPTKEEIITNDVLCEIYEKYYKYTTVTNVSGDYMIFGVPIGVQTVHMSVDITDIGDYSMNPASIISELGYPSNYFTSDKKNVKSSSDLKDLPNIETQDISVNIIPFWGDKENFEIGITRQDFRIRTTIKSYFVLFGSTFTDGYDGHWGADTYGPFARIGELYSASIPYDESIKISGKRNGKILENIYYYPNDDVSDEKIITGLYLNPQDDIKLLDKSEYIKYEKNGDFVFLIPCNRKKIITNDNGDIINVPGEYDGGVFTEFRGFITLELTNEINTNLINIDNSADVKIQPYRLRYKFPQHGFEKEFKKSSGLWSDINAIKLDSMSDSVYEVFAENRTNNWRMDSKLFCKNKFYTISKFHPITGNTPNHGDNTQDTPPFDNKCGILKQTCLNVNTCFTNDVGIITTENIEYEFPSNFVYGNASTNLSINKPAFGVNWLNMSIHFPQLTKVVQNADYTDYVITADYSSMQTSRNISESLKEQHNSFYVNENQQPFVANIVNTACFARPDLHWTDIVEVPVQDIHTMLKIPTKGFCVSVNNNIRLIGNSYRNAVYKPQTTIPSGFSSENIPNIWYDATPYGCKVHKNVVKNSDGTFTSGDGNVNDTYFYKGLGESNVINYLFELNLV